VAGLASSIPFVTEDPLSPLNRRISIIVMNKKAEDTLYNRAVPNVESSSAEEFKEAISSSGKSYEQMSPLERVHEAAKMAEQMKRGN
jgi:hypothetical protein